MFKSVIIMDFVLPEIIMDWIFNNVNNHQFTPSTLSTIHYPTHYQQNRDRGSSRHP